jgi:hypothetical protein
MSEKPIIPVNGFTLRGVFRDPMNGVVLIHYDAPGVGGRFQITTSDYKPVSYSVQIQNAVDMRSPIDGGPLPAGTYRIADTANPAGIYDLGPFTAPPLGAPVPAPVPVCKEMELRGSLSIPRYGDGKYFFASRTDGAAVILPTPMNTAGVSITVMNWSSTEGFAPEEARPFDVYFADKCRIRLMPGEKRTFTSIFTAQRNVLRWAIM